MVTKKQKAKFVRVATPDPKTQTELKRQAHRFSSGSALMVVEWLNATRGTGASQRVLDARQELEKLGEMLNDLSQQERTWEQWDQKPFAEILKISRNLSPAEATRFCEATTTHQRLREQFRARHNEFNRRIARYTYVPALAYSHDYGVWRFKTVPKGSRGPEITINDGDADIRVDESSVIAALCRLAANRELYKARLCDQCKKRWFVSERKMDRFCSQNCRETWHTQSPEYHEKKAANEREYRRRKKAGELAGAAAFQGRRDGIGQRKGAQRHAKG